MSLLLFCSMGQQTRRVPALGVSRGREPYRARKTTEGRQPDQVTNPIVGALTAFVPHMGLSTVSLSSRT